MRVEALYEAGALLLENRRRSCPAKERRGEPSTGEKKWRKDKPSRALLLLSPPSLKIYSPLGSTIVAYALDTQRMRSLPEPTLYIYTGDHDEKIRI